jgi:hypothetical protein
LASIVDIDTWTTGPVRDLEHTVLDTATRVADILVRLESDEALGDKVVEGLNGVRVVALFALFVRSGFINFETNPEGKNDSPPL